MDHIDMPNVKRDEGQDPPSIPLSDLNVGEIAKLPWQELTPAQWRDRMEDMHWILDMLFCARILGGLEHLDWEVAKTMTFPEYMKAVKAHMNAA